MRFGVRILYAVLLVLVLEDNYEVQAQIFTEKKTIFDFIDDNYPIDDIVPFCPTIQHYGTEYAQVVCDHVVNNWRCIPEFARCDGVRDCDDGSDEEEEFCRGYDCGNSDFYFKCDDGLQCMITLALCDGRQDCKDGSDEKAEKCIKYPCPTIRRHHAYHNQVRCINDGKCYPDFKRCDGVPDCVDGSDEEEQFCRGYNCTGIQYNQVKCKDGLQCIYVSELCNGNGQPACADGSDESEEFCRGYDCGDPRLAFKCKDDLQCMISLALCDGRPDCNDGSDESEEFCADLPPIEL